MSKSMADIMFEELELSHRYLVEEVVDYYADGKDWLIITLVDGRTYIFDWLTKKIRRAPDNPMSMTEQEFKTEFGIRLRKMMWHRQMTQNDLAASTGITQAVISGYVTGKTSPSAYNLDRILRALDCDLDDLIYTGRQQ